MHRFHLFFLLFAAALAGNLAHASDAPKLIQKDGRYALLVEGHQFLILGSQIHNSSSWPSELPQVWDWMETFCMPTPSRRPCTGSSLSGSRARSTTPT